VAGAHVGGRVDQQLPADLRRRRVAGQQGDDRRQVAAGAVAADSEARGVEAERGGVGSDPACRREGVVDGGG